MKRHIDELNEMEIEMQEDIMYMKEQYDSCHKDDLELALSQIRKKYNLLVDEYFDDYSLDGKVVYNRNSKMWEEVK